MRERETLNIKDLSMSRFESIPPCADSLQSSSNGTVSWHPTLLSCTTYALCCCWKGNASGKMLICTPGLCACHMLHVPLMFLMKDVFSCFLCCSLVLMTTEIRRDRGIMCGVKGLVSENQDKGEPQKSRREGIVLNKQQGDVQKITLCYS